MTGVLLGFGDGIVAEEDAQNARISRLGGPPVWLGSLRPTAAQLACGSCDLPLMQIAQIYAPLEIERVIHVFGCNRKQCSTKLGSRFVAVFRDQINNELPKPSLKTAPASDLAPTEELWQENDDWGGANDWNEPTEPSNSISEDVRLQQLLNENEQLIRDKLSNMSLTTSVLKPDQRPQIVLNENGPAEELATVKLKSFDCYYVSVSEESSRATNKRPDANDHETKLLAEYERIHGRVQANEDDTGGDSEGKYIPEKYEKTGFGAAEKALIKFQQRVSYHPKQCLRYATSLDIPPLKYTSRPEMNPDPKTLPKCPLCGGHRVFETQLMPALLSVLRVDDQSNSPLPSLKEDEIGMEWGTLFVYTCENSCRVANQTTTLAEEIVIVQPVS